MTKDEQARARLVEIALKTADMWPHMTVSADAYREKVRRAAGFKNPRTGSWCAAGLTAAMEDAGLVVPAPGTPARRGAVALLDWQCGESWKASQILSNGTDGPGFWLRTEQHDGFANWAAPGDIITWLQYPPGKDPAGWRRGHVALIVAVDDESITTVGWNEGNAPGQVMRRRLWRKHYMEVPRVPPQNTVLHRKSKGMPYGIARPVAR